MPLPSDQRIILLNWQKEISQKEVATADLDNDTKKDAPTTAGVAKTVKSNAFIAVRQWIVDLFEIPVLSGEQRQAIEIQLNRIEIPAHDMAIIDQATGQRRTTSVREGEKTKSIEVSTGFPIKIKHPVHKGVHGDPLYIGLKFPSYFNITMISQALGQMLVKQTTRPTMFIASRRGTYFPITYNNTKAPLEGWSSGAWLSTSLVAPQNITDVGKPSLTVPSGPTLQLTP